MKNNENKESSKKRGRKSNFKDEYSEQAFKLCLLGATDKEIADFFNVSEQTINSWKKKEPKFLESIKKGKNQADANVAEKLYKRALGYDCKATKFAVYEGAITDSKEYTEHYPPDTSAAIFWLKNRQPSKWRDKQIQDITSGDEKISLNVTVIDTKVPLANREEDIVD
ncbi:helix-turn-helix domain-containing protein [Coprobacter secundus]|uniref:Phage terminase small subunit n=1 Tax=Coprobacter secundus subsp. similis TaxID=2751153 RepID=A0A7G1I2J0_9BACT|nr:helix-turn-helix domain-containing protein [Coprobacter secundus]BCI64884.1 phage terminase small subunit [Coprobacter secundus subsp. similis]